jgi:hypothetical protein
MTKLVDVSEKLFRASSTTSWLFLIIPITSLTMDRSTLQNNPIRVTFLTRAVLSITYVFLETAPKENVMRIKKILVPVDGLEHSIKAAEYAVDFINHKLFPLYKIQMCSIILLGVVSKKIYTFVDVCDDMHS